MSTRTKLLKITKLLLAGLAGLLSLVVSWIKLIRPALIRLVERPGARLGVDSPAPQLETLPPLAIAPNWPLARQRRMPHYMVRGRGKLLDAVAQQLLTQVHAERGDLDVSAGRVAEATSVPGKSQALRFVHEFGPGQLSATDAMLRAEGPDLYLRLDCKPRTVLRYLQYGFYGFAFCAAMLIVMFLYIGLFGAWRGWVVEVAQKYAAADHLNEQNKAAFYEQKLLRGYYETNWVGFREKYQKDSELVKAVANNISRFQFAMSGFAPEMTVIGDKASIPAAYRSLEVKPIQLGQLILATRFFRSDRKYVDDSMLADIGTTGMLSPRSDETLGPPSLYGAALAIESLPSYWISGQNDNSYFASIVTGSVCDLGEIRTPMLHTTQVLDPKVFDLPLSILTTQRQSPKEKKLQDQLFGYFRDSTKHHQSITPVALFCKDFRLGMMHLGLPIGIMAGVIGFFVWRMPKSWLRFPCRWLRWKTPDDFETDVESKNGWLERCLLNTVLHDHFEVDRGDIIDLRN